MPWRLPAAPARSLPDAVILNRFLQDDFVFILGILLSPCSLSIKIAAMACPNRPGDVKLPHLSRSEVDKAELGGKGKLSLCGKNQSHQTII